MATQPIIGLPRHFVDIVADGPDGAPVLVVEVRASGVEAEALEQLRLSFEALPDKPAFGMVITPKQIDLYRTATPGFVHLLRLEAAPVLGAYDPAFPSTRIFEPYLLSLAEAWLRDLAYHWQSSTPPGSDELRQHGLLDRLENGTTRSEVEIGGDALS